MGLGLVSFMIEAWWPVLVVAILVLVLSLQLKIYVRLVEEEHFSQLLWLFVWSWWCSCWLFAWAMINVVWLYCYMTFWCYDVCVPALNIFLILIAINQQRGSVTVRYVTAHRKLFWRYKSILSPLLTSLHTRLISQIFTCSKQYV